MPKPEAAPTDIILRNGRIWTADPDRPWAEALVVRGERVLAVGAADEALRLAGPHSRTIDLAGGLVLPGLIDSHTHFLEGGLSLLDLSLRDVRNREDFAARIGGKARGLDRGRWIIRGGWDETLFSPVELPRRDWIDPVTPDHPVLVDRFDMHMGLANSLALRLAGITRDTPVPDGGEIFKDPRTGEPTGIIKDAARDLVAALIPPPSAADKRAGVEAALSLAGRFGLTSVTDMAEAAAVETYLDLLRSGRLTCRVSVHIRVDEVGLFSGLKRMIPPGQGLLKLGGVKGFTDGSLGSRTALFFEPYADHPGSSGIPARQMVPEGTMDRRLQEAERAGLQAAVHAIGDKANSLLLDMYERIFDAAGPRDRRWRIEHAQHLRPADIPRFGRLGVIASVQPYHLADDGRWAESAIGRERASTAFAFRSLLDSGAALAFGSDWPVAALDPLTGIYAAATRRTIDGRNAGGWHPREIVSLEEAVLGYTRNAAFAEFAERDMGAIGPGRPADLSVLDTDIFRLGPDALPGARCRMTILGGRVVFDADRPAGDR